MWILRGLDAPPVENKDLDEFVPEVRVMLQYLLLYLKIPEDAPEYVPKQCKHAPESVPESET
jgi:hypothetical protein